MKPRLILPLLLCALLLTGCYRQAEETFQQVDSAVVVSAATPTNLQDIIVVGDGEAGLATRQPYITPETMPGQVAQPTLPQATSEAVIAVTAPPVGTALEAATGIPTLACFQRNSTQTALASTPCAPARASSACR